jgi:hypothetical protein
LTVQETEEQLHKATDNQIAAELVQDEEKTFGTQDINIMSKFDA